MWVPDSWASRLLWTIWLRLTHIGGLTCLFLIFSACYLPILNQIDKKKTNACINGGTTVSSNPQIKLILWLNLESFCSTLWYYSFIFNMPANVSSSLSLQEHKQNRHTKASARISGSQMNATVSKAKTEDTNSSSSLFEILQQSITCFDKQTENKTRTDNNAKETGTSGQFSAFKIARRFSKVQARS